MKKQETSSRHQWSIVVPQTNTNDRGDIRRSGDPTRHPELGFEGCRTLYEAFRRGQQLNPLGACLGFRAISTNGMATPYIYSSYTEVLARVNAFAAGLETLDLVPPTQEEESMVLIGLYMKNCVEWFIAEQAIFCVSGATGRSWSWFKLCDRIEKFVSFDLLTWSALPHPFPIDTYSSVL
jgi:long-chain acyl-CoA synthetase